MSERVDHLVIGGGAYGTHVATMLAEEFPQHKVVLMERENELSERASINNHGRLHWGYQYPLHVDTALQTKSNAQRFTDDFADAVDEDVVSLYGIHEKSKISADDYERFCRTTSLPYERTDGLAEGLFGTEVIASFLTAELTFSADALRKLMKRRAVAAGVDLRTGVGVDFVRAAGDTADVITDDESVIRADHIFNCTYSSINDLHARSGLPLIPSVHERYSLFKVTLPEAVRKMSATVIYGPFASIVSNNSAGSHILAHVTHSNCAQSLTSGLISVPTSEEELTARYEQTVRDAVGYLPILQEGSRNGQIVEVKSVFGTTPSEGERRMQAFSDFGGVPNYNVIFGGKMNSFYDAAQFAIANVKEQWPESVENVG